MSILLGIRNYFNLNFYKPACSRFRSNKWKAQTEEDPVDKYACTYFKHCSLSKRSIVFMTFPN